jgi:hypothetical protein
MAKFIETHKASWGDLQNSTKEKRVATLIDGSPHKIYKADEQYSGSIFRSYDQYAIIYMGTNKEDFAIKDQLITSDGVGVEAKLTLNYNIIDEDEKIRKAIVNVDGERDLLIQSITRRLQEFIKNFKAVDIRKEVSNATTLLIEKLPVIEKESDTCFHVRSISVANFLVQNSDLNTIVSKSLKDIETENAQREITRIKLEKATLEQDYKVNEAKGQIELEKIKAANELELEKLKEQHKLDIEKSKQANQIDLEKQKLEVEKLKRQNEILHKLEQAEALQTEHGKFAFFPEEMFNVLKKELELKLANNNDKQKILSQFLQLSLNNNQSYQSGQLNAMKAFLSRHLNIQLTEQNLDTGSIDLTKEPEKLPATTEDKKVENPPSNGIPKDEEQ